MYVQLVSDNALRSGDLAGCARYLDGVGNNADVAPLWRQLAEQALQNDNVQVNIISIYIYLDAIKKYDLVLPCTDFVFIDVICRPIRT